MTKVIGIVLDKVEGTAIAGHYVKVEEGIKLDELSRVVVANTIHSIFFNVNQSSKICEVINGTRDDAIDVGKAIREVGYQNKGYSILYKGEMIPID